MSTAPQNNNENQEIDLSQISKKIENLFESIATLIFGLILFAKRNIIILAILFIVGAGLGVYMDSNTNSYDHQIIVSPNFNSTDYLYSKIDLINSKVNEGDTVFLKKVVGIKNPQKFSKIEIEPIVDIYKFIGSNPVHFEFVKLLSENGDLDKIVIDPLTSRNYTYHNISFSTSGVTSEENTVKPILNYLNDSDYYRKVQKEYVNNVHVKIKENDTIISQIDGVLNSFSNKVNGTQKSDKLVYFNENTELDEVIKTKNELITELGYKRIELINIDKIIKENSTTVNIKNFKGLNGKMKMVLPFLFLSLFLMVVIIMTFYKRQLAKSKA